MLLLPSSIHSSHLRVMVSENVLQYSSSGSSNIAGSSNDDDLVDKPSTSSAESPTIISPKLRPKMQVFEKYGCYYALDSNVLKLYQKLETSGQCDKVPVDVVAKKKIPPILWEAAYCSASPSDEEPDMKFLEENIRKINLDPDGNPSTPSDTDNDSLFYDVEDDDPTCVACGMPFGSIKELTEHQILKRHFGCPVCGEVFSSCKKLERHEQLTLHGFDSDMD